ncbi:TPA: hypothetical protein IV048_002729, partial [Enterococcus faecium]|nr:hypothetical protein [Enterococcus faecium]
QKNKNKPENEKIQFLEKNLAAFDIRKDTIKKCIEKLDELSKKYNISRKINWNIRQLDALDIIKMKEKFSTYDYVISNPPYVSRHNT